MIRFDSHVHSTHSPDGRDDLAAYARRVDEGVVDAIGFTEHAEFWPGSDGYGFLDPGAYRADVDAWRARGYDFWAGVEVDWMPTHAADIAAHLDRWTYDYVIASVHNLPTASISGSDVSWARDPQVLSRVVDEYHTQVASSLAVAAFDVVGHVGVWSRHLPRELWATWADQVADLEDDLARRIAASGKLLEINTSALGTARGEPCAGRFLAQRYRQHGGQKVTLGSDAHRSAHLARDFEPTATWLADLGLEVVAPWKKP